jgi:hypothetical protein
MGILLACSENGIPKKVSLELFEISAQKSLPSSLFQREESFSARFHGKIPLFPPLKRGIKGDLMAFQNAKMLPKKNKIDDRVKSRNSIEFVIPAKAGIQLFQDVLDPGFSRGDGLFGFLRSHQ